MRTGEGAGASAAGTAADGLSASEISARAGKSILAALFEARRRHGARTVALEDGDGRRLTYDNLLLAALALARVIRRRVPADTVAIMLPSSAAGAIAYFAVLAARKRPAMLNFTAGSATLAAACRLSAAGAVLTAERFLAGAKLEATAAGLAAERPLLMMEALRAEVTRRDKLVALARLKLGLVPGAGADDPAAVLFTSGSEGEPKGVVLTHRNLLANAEQVRAGLPLGRVKVFFNPLPIFHSYGLGPGMVLPLVLGLRLVLHPSPLRIREITQRIEETGANVLLATDTFLRQYARAGADGSLSSLQFAVCGAERVRPETRELVRSRFGFAVVEGYGVTETSPVLAANHPDDIRDGTVGRLCAGIEARLEPVAGLQSGGRLFVRGPNVMAGYLTDGGIVPPPGGWHDTGDVVTIEDGYVTIVGRLKRFAKIGGEMTSLVTVENLAGLAWPDFLHAAAAVPGPRGEVIVLLTEGPETDRSALAAAAGAHGLSTRYVPDRIFQVEAIPKLGTGKLDIVGATRLAVELCGKTVGG